VICIGSHLAVDTHYDADRIGKSTMKTSRSFRALWLGMLVLTGCADEHMVLHSDTGNLLIISRRAYTSEGCVEKLTEDAARLGLTFRHIHVRGTVVGRSLLWPFEQGYACEGAIGPEQPPGGAYPIDPRLLSRNTLHGQDVSA
jgi:hypothetical protein